MKKPISIFLVLGSLQVFAAQLNSFQEVHDAVKNGQKLTIVSDFSKCNPAIPNLIGSFSPSSVIATNNFITFSDNHFTVNNKKAANQTLSEFITYKLNDNDTLTLSMKIIYLPSYQIESEGTSTTCILKQGVNFFAS